MTEPTTDARTPDTVPLDDIAHVTLQLGRILLVNGAETEQVHAFVARFSAAFGCEAHLLVSYEALLATVSAGSRFRTKIGYRLPGINVGMAAIEALNNLVDAAEDGTLQLAGMQAALDAIERRAPEYKAWLIMAALGVTSASLSRLFGGDWAAFAAAGVAGAVATGVRLELGRRRVNPVLVAFVAALTGGVVGSAGVALGMSRTPSLCLVAPAMILVPGVPLINGIQDMIRNHVTMGVSRLGFAATLVLAVALGLFAATRLTGIAIPIDGPAVTIGVAQDAVFSALAGGGYALLFGVKRRLIWACAVAGVASHTVRTLLFHAGLDLIAGTLIGALAAGILAQVFARRFRAPAVAFAFPGVVAMVPGSYAFRAVFGTLQIAQGSNSIDVVTETFSLAATVMLMLGAIAAGLAAPALLSPAWYQLTRSRA